MTTPSQQFKLIDALKAKSRTWREVVCLIYPGIEDEQKINRIMGLCYQATKHPDRHSPTLHKILVDAELVTVKHRYRKIAEMQSQEEMDALDRVAQSKGWDDWTEYCRVLAMFRLVYEKEMEQINDQLS